MTASYSAPFAGPRMPHLSHRCRRQLQLIPTMSFRLTTIIGIITHTAGTGITTPIAFMGIIITIAAIDIITITIGKWNVQRGARPRI